MTAPITSFRFEHAFLSNFYPAPVILWDEGRTYPTVEHAYQAAKTFNLLERDAIFRMKTPAAAKRAGQAILSLRRDWGEVKIDVMHGLLDQKFAVGSDLAAKLKATGDAVLIESNHWGDTFWGVCRGEGQNHLGKLLMSIRATL